MKIHSEKAKIQSLLYSHFRNNSKLLKLYCYRYTTTIIITTYIIFTITKYYELLLKKSIFQSFCYCFSAPKIIVDLNLWQWETVSKHPTCNNTHKNFTKKKKSKINLKNLLLSYVTTIFFFSLVFEHRMKLLCEITFIKNGRRFSIFYFPCPPSQPPVLVC